MSDSRVEKSRRDVAVEKFAAAFMECMDAQAEDAAERAVARMEPKFEAIHQSLRQVSKAVNGKGQLPIDD